LLPADGWVDKQPRARRIGGPSVQYTAEGLAQLPAPTVDFFGDHVAFDKHAWRQGELD
jgi:hypothetical protein